MNVNEYLLSLQWGDTLRKCNYTNIDSLLYREPFLTKNIFISYTLKKFNKETIVKLTID